MSSHATSIIRKSDQSAVVQSLARAESYFTRLKGLIGTTQFQAGQGLLFPKCNSVHMWMMSIPIDVVFLKANHRESPKEWVVSSVHENLKPWKLFPVSDWKAQDALELPVGSISRLGLKTGEVLCIA